jgi:hypothetical protein
MLIFWCARRDKYHPLVIITEAIILSVRYAKRNRESLHHIPLRGLCNIYAKFVAVIVPNFLRPATKGSGRSSRNSENSTKDSAELDSWPSVEVMMFLMLCCDYLGGIVLESLVRCLLMQLRCTYIQARATVEKACTSRPELPHSILLTQLPATRIWIPLNPRVWHWCSTKPSGPLFDCVICRAAAAERCPVGWESTACADTNDGRRMRCWACEARAHHL